MVDPGPPSPPATEALRTCTRRGVRDRARRRPGATSSLPACASRAGGGGGVASLPLCLHVTSLDTEVRHASACVCRYGATLRSATLGPPSFPTCQGTERRDSPMCQLSRAWAGDSGKQCHMVPRGDSARFWFHPKRSLCPLEWPRGGPGCSKGKKGVFHLNGFASRCPACTVLSVAVPRKPTSWRRESRPAPPPLARAVTEAAPSCQPRLVRGTDWQRTSAPWCPQNLAPRAPGSVDEEAGCHGVCVCVTLDLCEYLCCACAFACVPDSRMSKAASVECGFPRRECVTGVAPRGGRWAGGTCFRALCRC